MSAPRLAVVLLALLLAGVSSRLSAAEEESALERVEAALQPVLAALDPEAEILRSDRGTSLEIRYRPQAYKIHPRSMTGEVSPEASDVIGPGFKGFVLKIYLQDFGEANQAVLPQTIREPYWNTELEVTRLGATDKQIFWALSPGARMDPDVLEKLRKSIKDLGKPHK